MNYQKSNEEGYIEESGSTLHKRIYSIWLTPFLVMSCCFICHLLYINYAAYFSEYIRLHRQIDIIESCFNSIIIALCGYWLLLRIINLITNYIQKMTAFKNNSTFKIILPFFATVIKTIVFLVFFNVLSTTYLPSEIAFLLRKVSTLLIITSIGWILFKFVDISERLLLEHFAKINGTIIERRNYTQALILKRVAYSIIITLTIGANLIMFDSVRALGASVLTTAGVLGIVLTFAAQRSLTSLFAGLEIALTQNIKIGDAVVFDNQVGTIEEINFRSVVIKLWDWRRLVVPTSQFLEKPFENWSRQQKNNLIGSIDLYVDFTLPVSALRDQLKKILEASVLWDRNIGSIEVSNFKEHVMQLKVLASAKDPADAAKLKAEIREKLIEYIVEVYPNALPRNRM